MVVTLRGWGGGGGEAPIAGNRNINLNQSPIIKVCGQIGNYLVLGDPFPIL